ncbi:MAG TPA: RNA methyltransferase, partial [Desulfobulbus sp.]|nr:RNA methyltransferase [Desulfobulbus sp.]
TRAKWGREPVVVATCAGDKQEMITYPGLRQKITEGVPTLLLFGTGWGLAPEVIARVDSTLPPIHGPGNYNHLSVRSAASIILDRLLGCRED